MSLYALDKNFSFSSCKCACCLFCNVENLMWNLHYFRITVILSACGTLKIGHSILMYCTTVTISFWTLLVLFIVCQKLIGRKSQLAMH